MKSSIVVLAVLATVGCETAPKSGEPGEEPSDTSASAKPPMLDTDTADASQLDGGQQLERSQVVSFKGVENLPDTHPCHDDATVVTTRLSSDSDPGFEVRTLGELRENPDTAWTHFGPRTVRGKRWTDDAGQKMVVACDMAGNGFRSLQSDDGERESLRRLGAPRDAVESASFVMGNCGECPGVEQTFVHWMSRADEDSDWNTDHFESRWSNDDEGNNEQYLARSWIIEAGDSDGDGVVESAVLMVGDCQLFHSEDCAETHPRWAPFTLRVLERSGSDMRIVQATLDHSGKLLSGGDEVKSGNVDKARAIIRESEKLK